MPNKAGMIRMKYTEKQRKEIGEKHLNEMQKNFEIIKNTNIFCSFVSCKDCPFDLIKDNTEHHCGSAELNELLQRMRGY